MGAFKFLWETFVRDPLDAAREVESGLFPTLEEEADVTVFLNPDGLRSDAYWLCCATAFGMVRNKDLTGRLLPNGCIGLEYKAQENAVRFVCRQESSWKGTLNSLKDPILRRFTIQLFGGVNNETRGGDWQWYADNPLIGGIPGTGTGFASNPKFGDLGYLNRSILTQYPTYGDAKLNPQLSVNPVPPFDSQSRGVPGIAGDPIVKTFDPNYTYTHPHYLLFNALLGPCSGADRLTTELRGGGDPPIPAALTTVPATPPVPPKPLGEDGITKPGSDTPGSVLRPPQTQSFYLPSEDRQN